MAAISLSGRPDDKIIFLNLLIIGTKTLGNYKSKHNQVFLEMECSVKVAPDFFHPLNMHHVH